MAQKFVGIVLPFRSNNFGVFEQSSSVIQQVRTNLRLLLLTKKGERVTHPTLGCDLWKVLYEPADEGLYQTARQTITEAIDTWMPFLELVDIQMEIDNGNEYLLNIKCKYRFRSNPNVTDQIEISADVFSQAREGGLSAFNRTIRTTRTVNGRVISSGNPRQTADAASDL